MRQSKIALADMERSLLSWVRIDMPKYVDGIVRTIVHTIQQEESEAVMIAALEKDLQTLIAHTKRLRLP